MPRARGVIDLAALKRGHAKFLREFDEVHTEALHEVGEFAQEHVRTKSKFNRQSKSGESVKDSTFYKLAKTSNGKIVRVWNRKIVKGFNVSEGLEYGTDPHEIVARRAKALRFVSNGTVFFRKRVKHPGTKAYKFLFKAVNAAHKFGYVRLKKKFAALGRKF